MKCAVCRDASLEPIMLEEGLAAHTCADGHGTWISSSTYFTWLEQRNRSSEESSHEENLPDVSEPETAKICPECGHILLRYDVGHQISFSLDHCDHCNGVWFDQHEWEQIRSRNLHDQIHRMFGPAWQRQVRLEQRKQARDELYLDKLGQTDYEEIKRIKAWLDAHAQHTLLLAFLNDPDPYKP